jgi:hypothetical protein
VVVVWVVKRVVVVGFLALDRVVRVVVATDSQAVR